MRAKGRAIARRLHLVTGLAVGGALALSGVSGAVLVFRAELDDAFHGRRGPVVPGQALRPVQELADLAAFRHPGARLAGLTWLERPGDPVRVDLIAATGESIEVLVDPYRGLVLGSWWPQRSPLFALRSLHAEAYMGRTGALVIGCLGLLLAAQGVSGLVVWWPARGFGIRWPGGWKAVGYDLHQAVGAASLLFNLPVALSGAALALVMFLAPANARPAPGPGWPSLPLDALVSRADAALNGRTVALRIAGERVTVHKRTTRDLDPRGSSVVTLDRRSGDVLAVHDGSAGGRVLLSAIAPLHFGHFAGTASKLLYLAGGLTSSFLAVTGYLVWLLRTPGAPRTRC